MWRSYRASGNCGIMSVLPSNTQEEYDFYSSGGRRKDGEAIVIGGYPYDNLTGANDCDCTFEQIADYIENNWEYL